MHLPRANPWAEMQSSKNRGRANRTRWECETLPGIYEVSAPPCRQSVPLSRHARAQASSPVEASGSSPGARRRGSRLQYSLQMSWISLARPRGCWPEREAARAACAASRPLLRKPVSKATTPFQQSSTPQKFKSAATNCTPKSQPSGRCVPFQTTTPSAA
jgi:hypothetical protein